MSWKSDRRKLNQLRGMIKVLVPAFITLWLWKQATESLANIWIIIEPPRTQFTIHDTVVVPVNVVGISKRLSFIVRDSSASLSYIVEDTSQGRRRYKVPLHWREPGTYGLFVDVRVDSGFKTEYVIRDTAYFEVIRPRPTTATLAYKVDECSTTTLAAIDFAEYALWTVEDTTGSETGNHEFIRPNKLKTRNRKGIFQLHGTSPPADTLGSVYLFEVIDKKPPELRGSNEPIYIGGGSPIRPGTIIDLKQRMDNIGSSAQLIASREDWSFDERSLSLTIPERLPPGNHEVIIRMSYGCDEKVDIKMRFIRQ